MLLIKNMFANRKADRLTLFYSDRDDGRFGGKLLALQQPSVRGVGWIKGVQSTFRNYLYPDVTGSKPAQRL